MSLLNHNINNFAGGVSQQAPEHRFDNQVESMDNFMITVAQGLRRRNPLENVATAAVNHTANMARHAYDRGDGLEKYFMTLSDSGLHVYDDAGVQKTVTEVAIDGGALPLTAWAGANWKKDIEFLTVGDTTFLLNKNITTAMTASLSPKINPRNNAFYWSKRSFNDGSGGGYTYSVTINGITFSANSIDSDAAMLSINNQINTPNGLPDYIRAVAIGSVLEIFVAEIHAPGFRIGEGFTDATLTTPKTTTSKYVRVRDSDNNILGLNIDNYETSYNLIFGEYELWCDIGGVTDFYNLVDEAPSTIGSLYYSNSGNAVSNSGGTYIYMALLVSAANSDFTFSWSDSWGDQASYGWKESIGKISDLPSSMKGFSRKSVGTIAVKGTDRDNFTNYYLTWEDDHWAEAVAEGIADEINLETLPAKLVRQANGTFELSFIDSWSKRTKGDEDSNPLPSFIGNTLSNMFFFKNRLCFTSEENTIMSEASGFFNFFATTAMEVLDSDPIDAAADSNTVSLIRNVNVVGGAVTLWSDNAQFLLSGGDVLSPSTTRITPTSTYESDNSLSPIAIDNEVLFFNKKSGYLEVLSYSPATFQTDNTSAESVSSHIPEYIPSNIDDAIASSVHNMMFLRSSSDENTIYVYKYYIKDGKKVISAWFKWTFADLIKGMVMLDNVMYLFANTDSILKIELHPKLVTDTFLDKGVTAYESKVVMSSYNVETRQDTQVIREPFYIKNIRTNIKGKVDLGIINSERNNEKTVNTKHLELGRKLVIGGNSDKINISFSSSYNVGCELNTVSVEGILRTKSRNI